MTPGPISEVPGFRRPEPQEELPPRTRQGPIIDAVPGIARAEAGDAEVARAGTSDVAVPDAAAPLTAVPLTAVPLTAVPLTAVPLTAVPLTAVPSADPMTFATQPVTLPPVAPAQALHTGPAAPPPPPPAAPDTAAPDTAAPDTAAPDTAVSSPSGINLWGESQDANDAEDLDATRAVQRPAILVLRWDDGTVIKASAPTVVGRDPFATGSDLAVALEDPSRSLSKTHARFTPGLAPTVEDLHSTNGVRIDRDGAAIAVVPGETVPLRHGDDVVCGTRRASVEVRA